MDELEFHDVVSIYNDINFPSLHSPVGRDPSSEHSLSQPKSRTRNPRSCDFCRARKTACIIETVPPCMTCSNRGIECVFTERPPKRKRLEDVFPSCSAPDGQMPTAAVDSAFSPPTADSPLSGVNLGQPDPSQPSIDFSDLQNADESLLVVSSGLDIGIDGAPSLTPRESNWMDESDQHALDGSSGTYFLLGNTGEADPYLLRHSQLAAHSDNMHFRHLRRDEHADPDHMLDNDRPLVYMLGAHSLYEKYEPRVENLVLANINKELARINDEVGERLVQLFFKYIYPYFPILSRSRVIYSRQPVTEVMAQMPLSLKAALYASALPFMIYDDMLSTMLDVDLPSSTSLYRMAWTALNQEIHTPSLSTLQSCLLLLQRNISNHYVQGSPFQWGLLAWTVSLAQTLGLSTDCSTLRGMPTWEKRLRKRLWWATYVLDKWNFTNSGLASHIHADNFDVLPLASADFWSEHDDSLTSGQVLLHEQSHFYHLTNLTVILSDIVDAFFSLRASRMTDSDFGYCSDLARGFRSRLHAWKTSFDHFISMQPQSPTPRTRLDGNPSLALAYPTVTIMLFRAVLRPLENPKGSNADKQLRDHDRESVRRDAEACCLEVVNFLEQVQPGAWNAFWHKFSPSNFAIVSSFMMRLLITSTSASEKARLNNLINRWRWAMRTGGGNAGNSLMSLGLLRLDRSLLKSGIRMSSDTY